MTSTNDFVERAAAVHGGRYDYSRASYVNARTKVLILCPDHGEFAQLPRKHVAGSRCPCCAAGSANDYRRVTVEEFCCRAAAVHGDRYDYSLVKFGRLNDKVTIICREHGPFPQSAISHLSGHGCGRCRRPGDRTVVPRKYDTDWFRRRAVAVHRGSYHYSRAVYRGSTSAVTVTCPTHGDFAQVARDHLNGYGCRACGMARLSEINSRTVEQFVAAAIAVHGSLYDYSETVYRNQESPVVIACRRHGRYTQTPKHHLRGQGCPVCSVSSGQLSLYNYLTGLGCRAHMSDRSVIPPLELDVTVPERRLAIEYNGVWWHSDAFPEARTRHLRKLAAANAAGWSLLQFWETEWRDRRPIVESMIAHRVGLSTKLMARRLDVAEPDENVASAFFDHSHLKGHRPASAYVALCDGAGPVCAMSFGRRGDGWELIRYACRPGHLVTGGASRVIKHFLRTRRPRKLFSYADRRYSDGRVYAACGFAPAGATGPNYHYVRAGVVYSRQMFQKHKLADRLELFNPSLSEADNMAVNGYNRLWDAGHLRFVMEVPDVG